MKFTVHVEGTRTEIASQLLDAVALFNGSGATAPATAGATASTKGKKAAAPAEAPAEEEDEGEFDLGEEESEDDAEEEDETPKISLDQVIAGFKDFAKKKGRNKAAAVLKKYGVKSVRDLKAGNYAEVLEALGAKK